MHIQNMHIMQRISRANQWFETITGYRRRRFVDGLLSCAISFS